MEDFRVTQSGDEVQSILNQSPIDTSDIAGLKEADALLDSRLENVEGKIPAGASAENPLTDKQYVDNAVATASATFRGTYNEVSDLELTTSATHAEIAAALADVIDTADNNDYCFVQIPTSDATPTEIGSIERYKFVTGTGWESEFTLNNSGFTSEQWAAINSGITSALATKLTDLPTNSELTILLNGKANAADVYTKSETYNKTELDNMITTPDVQYVTVTATAQTTAVTDLLPATGSSDTIYRIGSWDGAQYAANVYSEYAWDGTTYKFLDVKNYGIATGSDFDNPTATQRALLTTVGAVLDGCDATPTAGSVKPVQSGGVFNMKEDIESRIYRAYFDGKGNTSSLDYVTFKDLIYNHTYRVVFRDGNWDSSEISTDKNKMTLGYNDGEGHTLYTVPSINAVNQSYDITVPNNADRIYIGLRANEGVRIWITVYDVTDFNRIGDIITSTSDANKRRTESGSATESGDGNRYTILFPVKVGDYVQCHSDFDNTGVYVGVWDTVSHAFAAGATGRLQLISEGFSENNIYGFIGYNGYLSFRFKKADESSITDAEIEDIEESLTFSLSTAMMGKSAEVSKKITDESVGISTNKHDNFISDIDFADKNGNVILRVYDGNIKTKYFDSKDFVKQSYQRRIPFAHDVDTHNFLKTNFAAQDIDTYEQAILYSDNCVLYLPESYKSTGEPTKLIIFCKQGASTIELGSDTILSTPNTGRVFRYMLHLGYAILAADGVPDGWATAIGIGERAVGNYVAVQSTIKAFNYVVNNYNIDAESVFIWGYSQGGHYAQNVIDNSDIPFAAAAELSPVCSMRYHQWDLNASVTVGGVTFSKGGRLNIARIFDYPAVTTNSELEALEYDASKTKGYDPWERNVEDMYTGFVQNSSGLWKLPSGTSVDDIVMKKHVRCPVKIWAAENDATLSADVMKVFVKAIKNAGQTADLQLFTTGNHSIPSNQTSIGTFVENGETVDLYPIAKDVALWFYCFGGYNLK